MRNMIDIKTGLSGLHTILEGIAAIIDAIPVPSSGGGSVDYSETEQDTGVKWIDGKTIYQLTGHFNYTNSVHAVNAPANMDTLIDAKSIRSTSTPSTYVVNPKIYLYNNKITFDQIGAASGDVIYYTIYYTKSE